MSKKSCHLISYAECPRSRRKDGQDIWTYCILCDAGSAGAVNRRKMAPLMSFFNFRKLSQIEERWHGEMIFTENIYACNYIKKMFWYHRKTHVSEKVIISA